MVERISQKELNKAIESIGGIEAFRKSGEQHQKDTMFFEAHCKEWRKQYPNQWAAVYHEERVAIAGDYFKLLKILKEKGLVRKDCAVYQMSTKRSVILITNSESREITSPCFLFT